MTELEKVIDDLGRVMACGQTMLDCGTESPMVFKMIRDAADNAIVFLKAQEPVEPVIDIDTWKCGNCGHTLEHQELLGDNVLFHEQYNYCPECGKTVKWK